MLRLLRSFIGLSLLISLSGCVDYGTGQDDSDPNAAVELESISSELVMNTRGFYYPVNWTVTSNLNWNYRCSQYFSGLRHIGSDIGATSVSPATPVYAVDDGTVIAVSGPNESSGWGVGNYALAIQHYSSAGAFVAIYGHIRNLTVGVNSTVTAGKQLGTVGPWSAGDHLHFGIRPGSGVPPAPWGRVPDPNCNGTDTNGFVAPISYLNQYSASYPPTLSNHTYNLSGVTRTVTIKYSDPEVAAPTLKRLQYQYKNAVGTIVYGNTTMSLYSGSSGNGTYRWSGSIYGTQFKFYCEFQDPTGNYVRYPTSGWIQ